MVSTQALSAASAGAPDVANSVHDRSRRELIFLKWCMDMIYTADDAAETLALNTVVSESFILP